MSYRPGLFVRKSTGKLTVIVGREERALLEENASDPAGKPLSVFKESADGLRLYEHQAEKGL
jgi:hypothetical protein